MRFLQKGDKVNIPCLEDGIILEMTVADTSTVPNKWYFLSVEGVKRIPQKAPEQPELPLR